MGSRSRTWRGPQWRWYKALVVSSSDQREAVNSTVPGPPAGPSIDLPDQQTAVPGLSSRRGAGFAVASRVIGKVLGLGLVLLLARGTTTLQFAQYSYLLIAASTMSSVMDLGVASIAARQVARREASVAHVYRAALPTHLGTNLAAAIAVVVLGTFAPGPGVILPTLALTGMYSFTNGIFDLQAELLRASGRPLLEGALQVASAVVQVGFAAVAVVTHAGVIGVMGALLGASVVTVVAAQAWLPRPRSAQGEVTLGRALLVNGVWLGVSTTCLASIWRIGPLLLANLASPLEVARYGIASRFLQLGTSLSYTLGIGLLPSLARRASTSTADFRRYSRRLLAIAGIVAAIGTIPMVFVTPPALLLMFGSRYRGAAGAAQVVVAATPVSVVLYLSWFMLVALKRERWITIGALGGLFGSLAISLSLLLDHLTATATAEVGVVGSVICAVILITVLVLVSRQTERA